MALGHAEAQRHEERPLKNIRVFLCVLRDLRVRTTFYEAVSLHLLNKRTLKGAATKTRYHSK